MTKDEEPQDNERQTRMKTNITQFWKDLQEGDNVIVQRTTLNGRNATKGHKYRTVTHKQTNGVYTKVQGTERIIFFDKPPADKVTFMGEDEIEVLYPDYDVVIYFRNKDRHRRYN